MSSTAQHRSATRLVAALGLAIASAAASAEPRVISGIGEREAARLLAAPAPVGAPEPAPIAVAVASPGAYGGGFIELLMTGSAPPACNAAAARPQLAAYAPAQEANVQREIDPVFQRAEIDYGGGERAGTIVVDSDE